MIDLKGHAALITGATSGVGRAISDAFLRAGAKVVTHGLEPSADIAVDLSVCTENTIESMFENAVACLPNCDILVNNAGAFFDVPFDQMTFERLEKTLRLNVMAGYFLTQRFARHWIVNNIRGRVLFTGSINGRLAEPNSTGYDTSKGAVEMMVKTLAVALAPKGIRVNGIAPGLVRTAATAWLDAQPARAKWLEHHTPNGQIPGPEVCGPAAVFLCSDFADHIHGQMLFIDGGMSALQQPGPM